MKKIILISFLSFFISSNSYSNSKDIVISKPSNINAALIFNCTSKNEERIENVYLIQIHKHLNPGIVIWSLNPENIDIQILFISNLFFNENENKHIFYHNVGGKILSKYSYSYEEMEGSYKNKKQFSVSHTLLLPLTEPEKSFKLYEDGKKIFENWSLTQLSSLSHPFSKSQLSKAEKYSNSLKDLFEKQELRFKKDNEKFGTIDKFGKKLYSQTNLVCNPPDFRGLKNN